MLPHDEDGNAVLGRGMMVASRNCLVHSEGVLTAVIGGADLVVVSTPMPSWSARASGFRKSKGLSKHYRLKEQGK